jgi:outer membrane immunogenic protein
MKLSMLVAGAAVLSVAALTTMPAAAQDAPSFSAPSFYGNLGYTAVDSDDVTLGALGGRVGAKFHPNFGAEAEAAFGVKSDDVNVGGVNVKTKLKYSAAVYAVGFLPVTEQFDLLARVGYGTSKLKASAAGISASDSDESWNYGVGAQYTFDGLNGVRGDYTRHDFGSNGGDADVWTIAYVRKF